MNQVTQTSFACRCAGCRILFASAFAATVFCRKCWEMQIAEGQTSARPDLGGSSVPTDIRYVYVLASVQDAPAPQNESPEEVPQVDPQPAPQAEGRKAGGGPLKRLIRGLQRLDWLLALVIGAFAVMCFSFALSAGIGYLEGWYQ